MLSSTQPSVAPEIAKVEEKESGIGFVISRMFDIDLKNPKTLLPIAIAGAVVGFFIFGA
jgi:hypothetical protein